MTLATGMLKALKARPRCAVPHGYWWESSRRFFSLMEPLGCLDVEAYLISDLAMGQKRGTLVNIKMDQNLWCHIWVDEHPFTMAILLRAFGEKHATWVLKGAHLCTRPWVSDRDLVWFARAWNYDQAESCHIQPVLVLGIYPLGIEHSYEKTLFSMGESNISMAMFNSYVKLPEGNPDDTGWISANCLAWNEGFSIDDLLETRRGEQVKGQSALNKHFSDIHWCCFCLLFNSLDISWSPPIFSRFHGPCRMPACSWLVTGRACPEFLPENRAWGEWMGNFQKDNDHSKLFLQHISARTTSTAMFIERLLSEFMSMFHL